MFLQNEINCRKSHSKIYVYAMKIRKKKIRSILEDYVEGKTNFSEETKRRLSLSLSLCSLSLFPLISFSYKYDIQFMEYEYSVSVFFLCKFTSFAYADINARKKEKKLNFY